MGFRKLFIIGFLFYIGIGFFSFLYSQEFFNIKSSLKDCAKDNACSLIESIIFFPVFPWVNYLNDKEPHPAQINRFNTFNYEFDVFMTKYNEDYSGYMLDLSFLYKNIGFNISYDTFFDGFYDNKHFKAYIIFRLSPTRHIEPVFRLGWRYLETDTYYQNGPEISFFNYNIMFTRRFHTKIENYMFFLRSNICYENILLTEYYIYPTISYKLGVNIKYILKEMFYGIQTGFSLKLI
jgi:hypothetical protein